MRKILLSLILFTLLLLPGQGSAESFDCDVNDTTVIFVNGIFTKETDAFANLIDLQDEFQDRTKRRDVKFLLGYNPTRFKGVGDVLKAIVQGYTGAWMDYDLREILANETHGQLRTRKVLLVGHSQGTFYTNAAYDYLVNEGGVPRESIAVYNTATPADRVAGDGTYLTSSTDKLIIAAVDQLTQMGYARRPLPANIDLSLSEEELAKPLGGHGFGRVYLAQAPDRIIGDMQQALGFLSSSNAPSSSDGCFIAPEITLGHRLTGLGFSAAELYITTTATAYTVYQNATQFASHAFYSGLASLWNIAGLDKSVFVASLTDQSSASESQESRVWEPEEDEEEAEEATVAVATPDSGDQIDTLLERIDWLKAEIAKLQQPQNVPPVEEIQLKEAIEVEENEESVEDEEIEESATVVANNTQGGTTAVVYPSLLISEVQIGGATDSKEEFVELYNPTDTDVLLTNWYLQRKTKTATSFGTFASSNLFAGIKIPAHGYLVVAREGYFTSTGSIFTTNALTEDNALALKNPNGEISDKVGWGAATDFETAAAINPGAGQSIGRDASQTDGNHNANDFELNTPTPASENVVFSVTPEIPEEENPTETVFYKILINEIQVDSIEGSGGTNDDWVELYNPNDVAVDISSWSLQRAPESGTVSKKNFEAGNVIPAKGYFVVARTTANAEILAAAHVTSSILQLSDVSTVFLVKNQELIVDGTDADIVDKVGFGEIAFSPETTAAQSPPEGKSIERKKLGQDTDNNAADFKISDEVTLKGTFPKAIIADSTSYANANISANGIHAYNLLISWSSSATNIDFYELQYQLNGGDWESWISSTTNIQEYFSGAYSLLNNNEYAFRVRAHDTQGNVGDWAEVPVALENPVIISEVGMGETGPWIELYNRTDQEINLAGWKLVSGNEAGSLDVSLTETISAYGYVVIESTAPLGTHHIYLRDAINRYSDEVYIPSGGLSQGVERVSAYAFGFYKENWKSGVQTPGAQNSVNQLYTYISGNFIQDIFLPQSLSPYLFHKVSVDAEVILSIEPGTSIAFKENSRDSWLKIAGTLKAVGTDAAKIIFTTAAENPQPGAWEGIYFSPTSINSELEHVIISYAGSVGALNQQAWGHAVWVDQSVVSIKNSVIEYSKNRGIRLSNSDSIIDSVSFLHIREADSTTGNYPRVISIEGGAPTINNNYFEDNSYCVYATYYHVSGDNIDLPATPTITNNQFIGNGRPIYWASLSRPIFSGNTASGNNYNNIYFNSTLTEDITFAADLPYYMTNFSFADDITVTLDPGVMMEFGRSGKLTVSGSLMAIGNLDNPIIFRAHESEEPGRWEGVHFTSESDDLQMEHVTVMHAEKGVYIESGNPSIKNSIFTSNEYGIYVEDGAPVMENNNFSGSITADVFYVNPPVELVEPAEPTEPTP